MTTSAILGVDAADLAAVEAIVRNAGTSFYRGMRVLPSDRRHAMYAIYAFCRIVDDIADEDGPLEEKHRGLAEWRERISGLYAGRTDGPVTRVLAAAIGRFHLRESDFLAVIDGMQMDAETVIVAPPLAELDLYCDRVAAAVGRLSVRAFGDSSEMADKVAYALGRALQLTNILRDIKEDSDRGRVYLPREYLDDAGVPADPVALLTAPGLPIVCNRLARLAHDYFADARRAMEACDARAMKPARLMGATYDSILSAIERRGWRKLDERVSLPTWKKLWLACRYGLF
jgi:presqualene diphosphate synthase